MREKYFGGAVWYETLTSTDPAWQVAKLPDREPWVDLLNAGLDFATRHGLEGPFRERFRGIVAGDMTPERAKAEGRLAYFPIWEVANELIVAVYCERALGWRFVAHEPNGRGERLGDWEFEMPSGTPVFVEVKSIQEAPWVNFSGVFARGSYAQRLRGVLARAYKQLPDDRPTLVVLVGDWTLEWSHGIRYSDLFEAMFGRFEVRMTVMTEDPQITYAGPSFREMLVHGTKHRRIGMVAGLVVRYGFEAPGLGFYAIDNPYAYETQRIADSDIAGATRFMVSGASGCDIEGIAPASAWELIRRGCVGESCDA